MVELRPHGRNGDLHDKGFVGFGLEPTASLWVINFDEISIIAIDIHILSGGIGLFDRVVRRAVEYGRLAAASLFTY